jgi:hypothetical protein
MPSTYEPIATTTLTTTAATVTLSNIPGTYTDLVVVANITSQSTSDDTKLQFNGDTNSNYSFTRMYVENGVVSDRNSNLTSAFLGRNSTTVTANIFHIMNYSNTTTYKTALGRSGFGTGITLANVALWRSTSAITSITFLPFSSNNFTSGSTFTIYGIKAA